MANKIIIPTGYMGSGSSAVTDLVSEIDGFEINNGSYEYIFLHCPNGVFDLEDKLLHGNTALRSHEAIGRFLEYMGMLDRPGKWYANYQSRLSPRFLRLCETFINELAPVAMPDMCWYYQDMSEPFMKRTRRHIGRRLVQYDGRRILGRTFRPSHSYSDLRMAWPSPEKFYAAAQSFLSALYEDLGYTEHHLVLDQLILPHNLFRLGSYFDENVRIIVTARDPRDTFLLNKYFWLPNGGIVPLPTDANAFCDAYEAMRLNETRVDDERILRIYFEDLIYRYDETLMHIYELLGTDAAAHAARRGTLLRPEVSIHNTQLFRKNERFRAEAEIIEKRLGDYLYDFPSDAALDWDAAQVF